MNNEAKQAAKLTNQRDKKTGQFDERNLDHVCRCGKRLGLTARCSPRPMEDDSCKGFKKARA